MNMSTFIQTIKQADAVCDECSNIRPLCEKVLSLCRSVKMPDDTMQNILDLLNQIAAGSADALTHLRDYSNLLNGIAERTEIAWPPVCRFGKGE